MLSSLRREEGVRRLRVDRSSEGAAQWRRRGERRLPLPGIDRTRTYSACEVSGVVMETVCLYRRRNVAMRTVPIQ